MEIMTQMKILRLIQLINWGCLGQGDLPNEVLALTANYKLLDSIVAAF